MDEDGCAARSLASVSRRDRVTCLRQFLLRTYAQDYLISGAILDIAGGKGDLSWLLCNADNFDAIVVDPRKTDHSKLQKKVLWYLDHPRETKERSAEGEPIPSIVTQGLRPPFRTPKHLQLFVDADLLEALDVGNRRNPRDVQCTRDSSTCSNGSNVTNVVSYRSDTRGIPHGASESRTTDEITQPLSNEGTEHVQESSCQVPTTALFHKGNAGDWNRFWTRSCARAKAEEGKSGHHQPKTLIRSDHIQNTVTDAGMARQLLISAKLIVGFHPDEGTEPCIDLALALQIPFAVCPCCVFPTLFPHRRIDGHGVASYDDFLRYLRQKHPKMRTGKLDFHSKANVCGGAADARNIVLYMLPEDYA